jgi:DNA repair protein RadC
MLMKIKETPRITRPREKLIKYGPNKLTEGELLAIILKSGTRDKNVTELATEVLRRIGKEALSNISINELIKIKGLGPAKACEVVATFELGRRLLGNKQSEIIMSAQNVWDALGDIRVSKKEHFVAFYLDTQNQEIKRDLISMGTLNESLVHPREVFEPAVQNLCSQIIVAHNHPSGLLEPSSQDIKVTERLVKSGDILGITLLDHIIVTKEGYYSFRDEGIM